MAHIQEIISKLWRPESTHDKIDSEKMFIKNIEQLELLFNNLKSGKFISAADINAFSSVYVHLSNVDFIEWADKQTQSVMFTLSSDCTNIPFETDFIGILQVNHNGLWKSVNMFSLGYELSYSRTHLNGVWFEWVDNVSISRLKGVGLCIENSIEWSAVAKNTGMVTTFFSNWNSSTDFPENGGTGIILPGRDVAHKHIIYTVGDKMWLGKMIFNSPTTYTITWKEPGAGTATTVVEATIEK